jgi:Flp pilus assembly pilin Flp
MTKFTKFLRDDAGAVTIDWVALTAGILLLGIMVVYAIFNGGVNSLVSNINSTLSSVSTTANLADVTISSGGTVTQP